MKRTTELKAVELVRNIRDRQAAELAGKSPDEIIEFFNRAAQQALKRAVVKSGKTSHSLLPPRTAHRK